MRQLPKNHVEVIYMIDDQGAQAPTVTHVAPKLHAQIFVGNKALPTDQLQAASSLKPGQDLSNADISAAQQAIVAAYKAAKKPVNVQVGASISQTNDGHADVTWNITETKAKKPRDTDDRSQEEKDQIAPP